MHTYHLPQNIKHLRKLKKWSQTELAEHLGCNRGNIASYEKGVAEPNTRLLMRLSKVFDASIAQLVGEDLSTGEFDQLSNFKAAATKLSQSQVHQESDEKSQLFESFFVSNKKMETILKGFKDYHNFKLENISGNNIEDTYLMHEHKKLIEITEQLIKINKDIIQTLSE